MNSLAERNFKSDRMSIARLSVSGPPYRLRYLPCGFHVANLKSEKSTGEDLTDTDEDKDVIKPRPRVPKGNRPYALGDPHAERILYMVLAVATELSVLHDRVDTLERVGAARKNFSLKDLDSYEPNDEVAAQREAWRKGFIDRMFRILLEDAGHQETAERTKHYEALVKSLGELEV